MTIEQLGSLGELIGAVATIATLGYLALQIRQSTLASKTTNYLALSERASELTRMAASDPDLSDIYVRACANYRDLPEAERARAHMLFSHQFAALQAIAELADLGVIDESGADHWVGNLSRTVGMPGVRDWWKTEGRWFREEFRKQVDVMVSELDDAGDSVKPPISAES